ncbi:ArsA family ATPase [Leptolyngbya sp. 7M]|uniref:ArsA family ATPase n=1 Tax=Leptolyngbya sp. 7M TaxID=2812896 RepID=UPI001B8CA055|nr:ArsA-related P-loop ATPase [Leptolyngbya sp. 7M]QYO64811.1 hypothetical protein JVX88_35455 [Leptolyngbya sp. 7M]
MEVDAGAEFAALRETYREELEGVLDSMFRSVDASLDREAMERLLDLAPPGLDECMALLRILEQLERRGPDGSPWYDTIVVDTAPTGHMLRLLELPEVIQPWLSGLFAVFIKYDRVFRLPRLQARLVEISRGLKRLRGMLTDRSRCGVRVVSILTSMAHAECEDLVSALGRMGVGVDTIFLNLATSPEDGTIAPSSGGSESGLAGALRRREAGVRARYDASFPGIPRVVVHRVGDPRGLEGLTPLARGLYGPSAAQGRAA